jgi:hemerythrin superfamily protein
MQTTKSVTTNGELPTVGNDAIEILEHDHRSAEALLADLTQGPESGREAALEKLKLALTIHNATEENLVYPAIHDLAGRPMHAGHLYREQDHAKVVLWELSMLSPSDPQFQLKANKFRDALMEHIRDEEEREFPKLREAAPDKMAKLTADVREFRHTVGAIHEGSA